MGTGRYRAGLGGDCLRVAALLGFFLLPPFLIFVFFSFFPFFTTVFPAFTLVRFLTREEKLGWY